VIKDGKYVSLFALHCNNPSTICLMFEAH
jgi:hypothetical protein